MSGYVKREVHGYECARCGAISEAESPWSDDYPEGYFIVLRRVTEAQNHSITDTLFLCTKDCLVGFVQYGISSASEAWRPIARSELSKRKADRTLQQQSRTRSVPGIPGAPVGHVSQRETLTEDQVRAAALPRASSVGFIPIDPDTLAPNEWPSAEDVRWANSVLDEQHNLGEDTYAMARKILARAQD